MKNNIKNTDEPRRQIVSESTVRLKDHTTKKQIFSYYYSIE